MQCLDCSHAKVMGRGRPEALGKSSVRQQLLLTLNDRSLTVLVMSKFGCRIVSKCRHSGMVTRAP